MVLVLVSRDDERTTFRRFGNEGESERLVCFDCGFDWEFGIRI